mgnify:CR=1 FL=1
MICVWTVWVWLVYEVFIYFVLIPRLLIITNFFNICEINYIEMRKILLTKVVRTSSVPQYFSCFIIMYFTLELKKEEYYGTKRITLFIVRYNIFIFLLSCLIFFFLRLLKDTYEKIESGIIFISSFLFGGNWRSLFTWLVNSYWIR